MPGLVLLVAPWLEISGRIAAIVLCLFIVIFVFLAVAINLGLSFGAAWIREKAEIVKSLRPYVDSINTTTEQVSAGAEVPADASPLVRAVSTVPSRFASVDQKVEQTSDKVVDVAIEFRARATQAKAIAKTFFLPGLTRRPVSRNIEAKTPLGYVEERTLMDGRSNVSMREVEQNDIPVV